LEEKATMLKEDIQRVSKQVEELEASNTTNDVSDLRFFHEPKLSFLDFCWQAEDGDEKKYELLVKRDQDMQQFMDKFDEVGSLLCFDCFSAS
jgi:hypothetical protein